MADPSDQLEDARAFALAYCTRHGDPRAVERLRLELGESRVVFSTLDAAACGSSISGFLRRDQQERTLATTLSRIMRQRARDAAIADAGETGSPPWSLDIHVVAWTMLCNAGVHPLLLGSEVDRPGDRFTEFGRAVLASPIHLTPEIRAGRISTPAIGIRTGSGLDADIVFYESESHPEGPRLLVRGRVVAETAAAALSGRPLADILEHPLLDMGADVIADVRALRLVNSDAGLVIELEDGRTTLAPAPPGVRTDWLRFAWNP